MCLLPLRPTACPARPAFDMAPNFKTIVINRSDLRTGPVPYSSNNGYWRNYVADFVENSTAKVSPRRNDPVLSYAEVTRPKDASVIQDPRPSQQSVHGTVGNSSTRTNGGDTCNNGELRAQCNDETS